MILGSNKFSILSRLPLKNANLKVVKIHSKKIVSICKFKSMTHSVECKNSQAFLGQLSKLLIGQSDTSKSLWENSLKFWNENSSDWLSMKFLLMMLVSALSRYSSSCGQFHQHFYVQIFCTNIVSAAFSSYVPALAPKFRMKNARVNIDEIDTWMILRTLP